MFETHATQVYKIITMIQESKNLNTKVEMICKTIHIHYLSKVFGHPQKFLFLILKLFLMKQVKLHRGFIYHTEYKSS